MLTIAGKGLCNLTVLQHGTFYFQTIFYIVIISFQLSESVVFNCLGVIH